MRWKIQYGSVLLLKFWSQQPSFLGVPNLFLGMVIISYDHYVSCCFVHISCIIGLSTFPCSIFYPSLKMRQKRKGYIHQETGRQMRYQSRWNLPLYPFHIPVSTQLSFTTWLLMFVASFAALCQIVYQIEARYVSPTWLSQVFWPSYHGLRSHTWHLREHLSFIWRCFSLLKILVPPWWMKSQMSRL